MSNSKENTSPVEITELVLRDGHQSLFATRMRIDDMLPIAEKLDQIGYWSMESWGGATFDSCIRFLGEDPWERIREIKKVMPITPQQMLLRVQNLLGKLTMDNNLVAEAINLTLFGMGFVFVFLALMVVVTTMMSVLVKRFQPNLNLAATANIELSSGIDEKTEAIIKKAINMHTKT